MNDAYANGFRSDAENAILRARKATDTAPSPAKIEAGNYAKGTVRLHGLTIKLENPRGSVRRSAPGEKPAWARTMVHDYGYITGVEGADGDEVDVFIGPRPDSELVVVMDQVGPDGRFDEHKCMLGFTSIEEARKGYLAHYPKGWKVGDLTALTIDQFKRWLTAGKTKKPVKGRVVVLLKARRPIKHPGSRNGKFYFTKNGKLVYGAPPKGTKRWKGVESRDAEVVMVGRGPGPPILAGNTIRSPADTAAVFRAFANLRREQLWLIHMDQAGKPFAVEGFPGTPISVGTHPREFFFNALKMGTSAIAMLHNHPTGEAYPSDADTITTARLMHVGEAIGVPVRHHVVVDRHGWSDVMKPTPGGRALSDLPVSVGSTPMLMPESYRVDKRFPKSWETILERHLATSSDLALIGAHLLRPVDRIALAVMLDPQEVIVGVFPIAANTVSGKTIATIMKLAISTGADQVAIAAGRDGEQWQAQIDQLHTETQAYLARLVPDGTPYDPNEEYAEFRLYDTVSVGPNGQYRSVNDHGSVQWGGK